jgi:hypothetical protein
VKPLRLDELSVRELLVLHADASIELRRRKLIRSANNPIADLAEWVVAKAFDLDLVGNSTAGFDAKDRAGERYEIKARRISSVSRPTHLSAIRALDKQHFDFLVAVVFADDFTVTRASKLSFHTVKRLARYRKHVNGHLLYLRDIWSAEDVIDVTSQIAETLKHA